MTKAVFAVALVVGSGAAIMAQPRGIHRVAWLQGCWETVSAQRTIEEQWMSPRGANMVGMSRTIRSDVLAAYEFLLLREAGDQLEYESHPSGQKTAKFLSTTLSGDMVVFENPQHDFPQRIGYRRKGRNMLIAWIEGTEKGQPRRVEFPYRRIRCAEGGN